MAIEFFDQDHSCLDLRSEFYINHPEAKCLDFPFSNGMTEIYMKNYDTPEDYFEDYGYASLEESLADDVVYRYMIDTEEYPMDSRGPIDILERHLFKTIEGINGTGVYCLANDYMPGVFKVGMTKNVGNRMRQLYTTAVPSPFYLVGFIPTFSQVEARRVERYIHHKLYAYKIRSDREFFKLPYMGQDKFVKLGEFPQ